MNASAPFETGQKNKAKTLQQYTCQGVDFLDSKKNFMPLTQFVPVGQF